MIRNLFAALLPLLLVGAGPSPAAPNAGSAAIVQVADGGRDDSADIWFTTWDEISGFAVSPNNEDQARAIFEQLKQAAAEGGSITVRFDADSGELPPGKTYVRFRACAMEFGGAAFAFAGRGCGGERPRAEEGSPGIRALVRGVAAATTGARRDTVSFLSEALADTSLSREGQIIGLRARESAWRDGAAGVPRGTADRALVAALADARRWAELAPADVDARLSEAFDLSSLGAYDEAVAAYRRIVERWPDEDYRASVRVGAIYRGLGDNAQALAALDGLVARHGAQVGMKFHYHRGWTLTNLDRNEEAVVELSAGLKEQPDYAWAYIWRACALGKLGRIAAAAADQHQGLALTLKAVAVQPDIGPEWRRLLDRARAAAAELDALKRTNPTGMTAVACTGYPDPEAKRVRSELLPRSAL